MEPLTCWPPDEVDEQLCTEQSSAKQSGNILESREKRKDSRSDDYKSGTQPKRPRSNTVEDEPLANVALARWWRSKGHALISKDELKSEVNANPNTFLRQLARLPEVHDFLRSEITRLSRDATSPRSLAALATFLEKMEHLPQAMEQIGAAVDMDPNDKEIRWLHYRMKTKLMVQKAQVSFQKKIPTEGNEADLGMLELCQPIPVEHRSARDLTLEEFRTKYSQTSTPVVIKDLAHQMTSVPWSIEHIKQSAGEQKVTLKKIVPGSPDWAQLENAETVTVSDFLSDLSAMERRAVVDQRYLFDWSLPLYCPQLAKEITVPKYFAANFLKRTEPDSLYHDSWPSLFIAPKGLRSELHVDAFGSNFWMALFQGRKRWVFFRKEDLPQLYPSYESDQSMDPVFEVNLREPDLSKHPLLSLATPRECVLEPGEVLFVPAGCPHYVENLEQSLAISSNFVDESNLKLVTGELEVNSLLDERALDLLRQLNSSMFETSDSPN